MKLSLKAARVNAGVTQEAAGKAIGVERNTIGNWEKGKSAPRIDQMYDLCKLYNISVDDIFLPIVQP